jgi:hypothetical protein
MFNFRMCAVFGLAMLASMPALAVDGRLCLPGPGSQASAVCAHYCSECRYICGGKCYLREGVHHRAIKKPIKAS